MQLTYREKGHLPSGRGVSHVSNRTSVYFKIEPEKKTGLQPQGKYRKQKGNRMSMVMGEKRENPSAINLIDHASDQTSKPRLRSAAATGRTGLSQSQIRRAT